MAKKKLLDRNDMAKSAVAMARSYNRQSVWLKKCGEDERSKIYKGFRQEAVFAARQLLGKVKITVQ